MTPATGIAGAAAHLRVGEQARATAEAAAVGRLLNVYVREAGAGGLHTVGDAEPAPAAVEAAARAMGDTDRAQLAWTTLPRTRAVLVAPLAVRSVIGHHRLAGPVWRVASDPPAPGAAPEPVRLDSAAELAATVAAELLAAGPGSVDGPPAAAPLDGHPPDRDPADGDPAGGHAPAAVVDDLRAEVAASVDRCARYVAAWQRDAARPDPVDAPDPTQAAEGALAFGHPFHPAPKLADGFDADDLAAFAPELSPGFRLWWLAAPAELVEDEHLPGAAPLPVPPDVGGAVRRQLPDNGAGWRLLPCHPWQARALARRDEAAGALADGTVRLVGPLGPEVRPTSSVRTVRAPDGSYWKLSLDVRITNFVRHNTPEQVRRALDAGRIVTALPPRLRSGRLEILPDTAYRALALPGASGLTTATAALHRPAPTAGPADRGGPGTTPPMVVAALVEPDPRTGVPPLHRLLAAAAESAGVPLDRIGRRWLRAYLRISLRPLLRLLLDQGISLEAHTQNSLAGFVDGWPARLVVRDLEGTSVDTGHPLAAAHRRLLGTDASPVLYAPEEAWQRFAYYVAVNHIGQMVATVAAETGVAEGDLWAEVGALIRAEEAAAEGPPADQLRLALLGPTLPAKANLISRLLGRSERPVYVDVPNPWVA
ncbi:MAG TPA: IucA/IucC family protein [Acidimicrobiales bacterium]